MARSKTQQEAYDAIAALAEHFAGQIEILKKAQNETETRIQFINPLFAALGWDVDNTRLKLPDSYRDVIHEDKLKISGKTKAPDYCFTNHGKRLFFLEAKKPSVHIKTDLAPSYQLRRYGWSAKLPISILTDFEEFALYDCTRQPKENDPTTVGRLKYFTFEQYLSEFDWLWDLFAKEQVVKGSLDQFARADKKGTQSVDYAFLQSLDEWRNLLASNIALRNKNLDEDAINYVVQMNINRIVFLRNCEDRGVEPYGKLRECLAYAKQEGGIFKSLFAVFEEADRKYNSGLFDFAKDTLSRNLAVDNKTLQTIVSELYYPKSPYEFSVIGVEILGTAYERFLGKVIRLTPGHQAKVEEKPEVRKAGGVYYTPQYIVEYIVRNTVGPLTEGKTPAEIARLKICDPACGSGSFLLGAYQYLLNHRLDYYLAHPAAAKKDKALTPQNTLATAVKKQILLDNIFGVDIDAQAVEVTKLSLLMKCMEGETQASLQTALTFERVLPTLDDNIQCGNSLIDFDFYDGQLDFGDERKIKPFNWKNAFPQVFKQGGFDAVIGNPPYIRIQTLKEYSPQQVGYFSMRYKSAARGNYDIYLPFIEKSLQLLNSSGRVGFILPHKFFNAEYGQALRQMLAKEQNLREIVYFGDNQIFADATTYTCLLFLDRQKKDNFRFVEVKDLNQWRIEAKAPEADLSLQNLDEKAWNFNISSNAVVFEKIKMERKTLGEVAKIFVGIQTSADPVYILSLKSEAAKTFKVFSKELKLEFEIEKEIVKPLLKGAEIRRYQVAEIQNLVLFPYRVVTGKIELISANEFQVEFPKAWKYLNLNKDRLLTRGDVDKNIWWHYPYPKNLVEMSKIKILTQVLAKNASYTFDENADYCFVGGGNAGGYGIISHEKHDFKPLFLVGLLNSKLLDAFLKSVSTTFRGGYYSYAKRFIEQLPIHLPDLKNATEKSAHDEIVKNVDTLLQLNAALPAETDAQKREQLKGRIAFAEQRIDELTYALYGLTEEEIRIVEGR